MPKYLEKVLWLASLVSVEPYEAVAAWIARAGD
jgi:hypothetical protein